MWLGIVASLGVSRRVVKKYLESFIMRAKIEKCGNHGNPPCRSPCHREGIRSGARPPLRAGPVAIPRRRRRHAEMSRVARIRAPAAARGTEPLRVSAPGGHVPSRNVNLFESKPPFRRLKRPADAWNLDIARIEGHRTVCARIAAPINELHTF